MLVDAELNQEVVEDADKGLDVVLEGGCLVDEDLACLPRDQTLPCSGHYLVFENISGLRFPKLLAPCFKLHLILTTLTRIVFIVHR